MKIKLTSQNKEPRIINIHDVEYVSVKNQSGLEFFYYRKSKGYDYSFEVLEEESKGSPELDVKQPTQKPMSALEHLQKAKELIG